MSGTRIRFRGAKRRPGVAFVLTAAGLFLTAGLPFAVAQYNGQLYGPVNVDTGATDSNLNSPSTASATTNGNIRYQWRLNGSGTSTAWIGFEWDSRTRVFSFYGNPTFGTTNGVIIRGDMDIGGSAYGWGNPGNFGVSSIETSKKYIFNITDSGTTLSSAPGNDQINLALTEINHTAALVNSQDGATNGMSISRSGNTITLSITNATENAGSNEELWYKWTHNSFSTKNYIQDTAISANDSVTITLSASAPILREGDTLEWLVASTGPSSTSTVSATTGGMDNYDIIAINKSRTVVAVISDDDTTAPTFSGFRLSGDTTNTTDGAILAGFTVTGLVQDAGSGVNVNGATVTGDNFSPNYDILNHAGTQVLTNMTFSTAPADGGGQASAAALAEVIGAGEIPSSVIDLGNNWRVRISATDNDEDPSTSANDRTAATDSLVLTFNVTDDDTTGPVHSGFTGQGRTLSGATFTNTELGSGLVVTGLVTDAQSGVYGGTSNRYTLFRAGATISSGGFTAGFSDGSAVTSNGQLTVTLASGDVSTSGSYTLRVFSVNYDLDRAADAESTTTDIQFTVAAAAADVDVRGNNTVIADGDTTPTLADHTDFSDVLVAGGTLTRTYTITNSGAVALGIGNVTTNASGVNKTDFVVTVQPAATLAVGATTTFQVQFDPSAAGSRSSIIEFTNTVGGAKSPYTFTISGTGTYVEVAVRAGGNNIPDDSTVASATNGTHFGTIGVSGSTSNITYTVTNTGNRAMTLGTITTSGTHAANFIVTLQPTSPLNPSNSTSFTIQFDPSATGLRTAVVSFTTTDDAFEDGLTENPFNFTVQGIGAGTGISNSPTSIAVSSVLGSAPSASNIGITNVGLGTLTYSVATNAPWLSVSPVSGSLAPGAGQQHTVTYQVFGVMAAGVSNATVTFTGTDGSTTNGPVTSSIAWTISAITNPTAQSATADGKELVRLAWTKNGSHNVMIIHNRTNAPTAPTNGTAYSLGFNFADGSRVIAWNSSAATLEHVVPQGSVNHYAFYSINNNYYSPGVAAAVTTAVYEASEIVDPGGYTNAVNLAGLAGGQGWTNAWSTSGSGTWQIQTNYSDTANEIPIMPTLSGYPATVGNRMKVDGLGSDQTAFAFRYFNGVTNGSLYVASLVSFRYFGGSGGSNRYVGISLYNGGTEEAFVGRAGGNNVLAIDATGSTKTESSYTLNGTEVGAGGNTGNVYLIVTKYDFDGNRVYAKAYFRTDTVDASEPTWTITNTPSPAIGRVDGIRIGGGAYSANSIGSIWFDEVRVATTWDDLVLSLPTYEWDAGGGASDRSWSTAANWTRNTEPTITNSAFINGGYTGVVSAAGERAGDLHVGSTNMPANGVNRTGTLEMIGGDLIVGTNFNLGRWSGARGTFLGTNGTLTVSNALYVGNQGVGVMTLTNTATARVLGNAVLGNAGTGNEDAGSVLRLGGAATMGVGGQMRIGGDAGTATGADGALELFGGSATVTGDVVVADNTTGTGRVTVAAGTLSMLGALRIGDNATAVGLFQQHGGTSTVSGLTQISLANTTNARLVVAGGLFNAIGNVQVGAAASSGASGFLVVSGGLLSASGSILVGNNAGATGSVHVVGGVVNVLSGITVGGSGNGAMTISGGAVTSGTFRLADLAGSTGSLTVAGGRLVITNITTSSFVFDTDSPLLNQTGGYIEMDGLEVGDVAGAQGTILLSGGTMLVGRGNATASDLQLGNVSGATGILHISGGVLDLSRAQNDLRIGDATTSRGLMTMSGGTATVSRVIAIGSGSSSLGNLFFTNGLLESTDGTSGGLEVGSGSAATGRVEQSGGRIAIAGGILIGSSTATSGYYRISGGTLTNGGALTVGNASGGAGTLEVIGSAPVIHVGDSTSEDLTVNSRGTLQVVFDSSQIATIRVSDDIILSSGATLVISNNGVINPGTYVIATSLNNSAVSGTFTTTNWFGYTGTVSYANNRIAIIFDAPAEIEILGTNLAPIASGDVTPDPADGTDYRQVNVSGAFVDHTFFITNSGTLSLTVSGVTTSGSGAADFIVTSWPSVVGPTSRSNLVIRFDPSVVGVRTAVITVANSDSDEGTYTFTVRGTGAAPNLVVSPLTLAYTTMLGSAPANQTFTVTNDTTVGTLSYTNYQTYGVGASGWLTVAPSSLDLAAGASQIHTGTVSVASITAAGTYIATNRVAGNQTNAAQEIVVTLNVTNIPPPTAQTAQAAGAELVRLNWTRPSGLNVLIIHNRTNAPSAPVNGTGYSLGHTFADGSRVIAWDTSGAYLDHVVPPGSTNFYAFYTMNGNFYSAAASAAATTTVYAAGVILDAFAYTNNVAVNGLNGGQGWSNAWTAASGYGISTSVFSSVTGYPADGGNVLTGTSVSANREFTAYTSGKLYVSYKFRISDGSGYAGLSFRDNSTEHIFFGERGGVANTFAVDGQGGNVNNGGQLANNTDYTIIGMYDFDNNVAKGLIYTNGSQSVPAAEPVTWHAEITDGDPARINRVQLESGSGTIVTRWDEVRVATNWHQLLEIPVTYPAVTNFLANGGATVVDSQISSGTVSIVMHIRDTAGVETTNNVSPYFIPNYDILNSTGGSVVVDEPFASYGRLDSGRTAIGTDTTFAAVANVSLITLGSYTSRISAANSNGLSIINVSTTAAGTAMSFTVVDDDTNLPEISQITSTNVAANRNLHISRAGAALSGGSGSGTNVLYSTTDGVLAGINSTNALIFWVGASDTNSGLARGTVGATTNTSLSIDGAIVSNVANFDASRSSPFADTFNARATNVWTWTTAFSATEIDRLVTNTAWGLGTNPVLVTLRDADFDRGATDQLSVNDQQVGLLVVTDDDTAAPAHGTFVSQGRTLNGGVFTNSTLISGMIVTGSVTDAGSGLYAGTSNTYVLTRNGTTVDTGSFTPGFANGGQGALSNTFASTIITNVGAYTVTVVSVDYDIDRPNDSLSVTSVLSFTVVEPPAVPGLAVAPLALTYHVMLGGPASNNTFAVTNVGVGTLFYTNYQTYGSGASGWFAANLTNHALGTGSSQIHTGHVSVASITSAGTYVATNRVAGNQTNAAQEIVVTLNVTNIPSPTAVTATADGSEQVDVSWTPAGSLQVIVVHNRTNAPGALAQNTAYANGDLVGSDGSRVVYKGAASTFEHIVTPGVTSHYAVYSFNGNFYSPSVAASLMPPAYGTGEIVEAFAYTNTGTLATSGHGNGGQGWTNAWTGDASSFNISGGSFANHANWPTNYSQKVRINSADLNATSKAVRRHFSGITTGKVYVGFILNYQFNGPGKWAGVSFMDGTTEEMFFGETSLSDERLGVGGAASTSNLLAGTGNDYIVIGMYDFDADTAYASAYRIGTRTVPLSEPGTWDITTSDSSIARIDGVRMAAGASSGTPGDTYFDEVRVAQSWEDLIKYVPQLPALAVGATTISNTVMLGTIATNTYAVTNVGGGTLLYTNTVTHGTGWLGVTVTPTTASLGAGASRSDTVTVSSVGLSAGTYYATNRVAGNQTNSAAVVNVILTVTNIPSVLSASASPEGAEFVRLAWSGPAGLQVLVTHRATNAPSDPVNATTYAAGSTIGSDGTRVIYVGSLTNLEHVVLPGSANYYEFWTVNNSHYAPSPVLVTGAVSTYLAGEIVDAFAYTNANAASGLNGGQGWTNAWSTVAPTPSTDVVITNSLFGNFLSSWPTQAANRLILRTSSATDYQATRNFAGVTNGRVYVAAQYRRQFNEGASDQKFSGVRFVQGSSVIAFVGERGGSGNADIFGVSTSVGGSPSAVYGATNTFSNAVEYLIVGRYDFDTDEFAGIYYTTNQTIPAVEPTFFLSVTNSAIARIDGVSLVAGAASGWPGEVHFDEVRVATNWATLINVTYTDPVLAVSPTLLSNQAVVAVNPTSLSYTVQNIGGGPANLDFTNAIAYSPAGSWLTITPSTGRIAAAASQVYTASYNVAGLSVGTYYATNTIRAGVAGTQTVSFVLVVGAPGSAVGPTTVNATSVYGVVSGPTPFPSLFLTNVGSGGVSLHFSNTVAYGGGSGWLSLSAPTGSLAAGGVFTNTLTLDATSLNPGTYTATITVNGNQTNAAPVITVNFNVQGYRVGEIYDGFTNAVAAVYTNQFGGTGWTNRWTDLPNGSYSVVASSLSAPSGYPTPQGNRLQASTGGTERRAFRGFEPFDSGRIYIAALVQAQNPIVNSYVGISMFDDGVEQLFFGKRWAQDKFGVETPLSSGDSQNSTFNFGNGTYLIIGMYDFDDDYFLGDIYNSGDTLSTNEPTSWRVSNDVSTVIARVDGIRIGALDVGTVNFDEIRVAPSWEELINAAPSEPTVNAQNMRFNNVTTNSMDVSWNSGSGAGRIVVAREGSSVTFFPVDGSNYTASSDFLLATDLGSGNKIVYNGTGTNFTFTSLNEASNYYFKVFEYNGSGPTANYLTNSGVLASNRWTLLGEPASQPAAFDAQSVSSSSITSVWNAATSAPPATGYLILRSTNATPTGVPVDGTWYSAGDVLGNGIVAAVVDSGSTTGTLFTGLSSCTLHYFSIFSFRRSTLSTESVNYRTNAPATDSAATECTEPTLQASNIVFTAVDTNAITLQWQNGDGNGRIVVARSNAAVSTMPVDLVSYTASTNFGSGSALGSGFVVFNGTGSSVRVVGLLPGVTYHFRVFDYIGSGGSENYNTNVANNNPRSTATAAQGLIYEPFDYGIWENLSGKNGGTGWTSSWVTAGGLIESSNGDFPDFGAYPPDTPAPTVSGFMDMGNFASSGRSASRNFARFTSGRFYMALKVNDNHSMGTSDYLGVDLLNGGVTTAFFGKASGTADRRLTLVHGSQSRTNMIDGSNSGYQLNASTDYLLVAMYDFNTREFKVSGYIASNLAHADPDRELGWSVEMTNVTIDAIDGIKFVASDNDQYVSFDSIRIGPSWEGVMWDLPDNWHEDYGPTPTLVYIGTNYDSSVYGLTVTNLSDAELKSAGNIDFAVRWEAPSGFGMFITNAVVTNRNIGSPNARVSPNWDPLAIGAATNPFNLDKFFTNAFGFNGATVITTYHYQAFNITNIDFEIQYFVTVSAEADDGGSTVSAPNGAGWDAVPRERAITINEPLRFYVYDDDTNAPTTGTNTLAVLTNSASTSFQTVGALRRFFVTDGSVTTVGFSVSAGLYDSYSGLRRSASGPANSNLNLSILHVTTNDVARYDASKSTSDSTLSTATNFWTFANTNFTYDRVGVMYGAGDQDLTVTYDAPDADDDRVNDATWASNGLLGYIRITDDDIEAPSLTNITAPGLVSADRFMYVTTNNVHLADDFRSGVGTNVRYTLTDGDMTNTSGHIKLAFGATDRNTGLSRGTSGSTNEVLTISIGQAVTANTADYSASLSSPNGAGTAITNVWSFGSAFTETVITQLMAVASNQVFASLADSDNDRTNDTSTAQQQHLGWLTVIDDDTNAPAPATVASVSNIVGTGREIHILTNSGSAYDTGDTTNRLFRVSDGELNSLSAANPLRVTLGVLDVSGIHRGTSSPTNMTLTIGSAVVSNNANWSSTESTPLASAAGISTNVWRFETFSLAQRDAFFATSSNQITATIPDADRDRSGDSMTNVNQQFGWLSVYDDDTVGPLMSAVQVAADTAEGTVILSTGFETNENWPTFLASGSRWTNTITTGTGTGTWYGTGYVNLNDQLDGFSKAGFTVTGVGQYFELPPRDNPGVFSVFARLSSGTSPRGLAVERWDGANWVSYGTNFVTSTNYASFTWTIQHDETGVVLRLTRVGTDGSPGIYMDNVSLTYGEAEWLSTTQVAVVYQAATDASGIDQYRRTDASYTPTVPTAIGDGTTVGTATSFLWDVTGLQGVLTGYLFGVDADNDRTSDNTKGTNAVFIARIDTNPPLAVIGATNDTSDPLVDDTEEIKVTWTPAGTNTAQAAGRREHDQSPLSPWDTYIVTVHELNESLVEVSTNVFTKTNGYANLGTNVTSSIIVSNLDFDTTFRIRVRARDIAGNLGPEVVVTGETVRFVVTQGLARAESTYSTSNQVEVFWLANTSRVYDVLYTDSTSLQDSLTNTWKLMSTITNNWILDNGGTSPEGIFRVAPGLNQNTIRFYRVARKDVWRTNNAVRRASIEVYAAKAVTLRAGENWVSTLAIPDTSTVAYVFGTNRLPAGASEATATRILWYGPTQFASNNLFGSATNIIWLGTSGNWWYSTGGVGIANNMLFPYQQGFTIELPAGAPTQPLVLMGLVPTQEVVHVIAGASSTSNTYHVLNVNIPARMTVSQLGLIGSGFTNGTTPFTTWDELRVLSNSNGVGSVNTPRLRIRSSGTNLVYWSGGTPAGGAIIEPDEAVMIIRRMTNTMYWTNRPPYTAPGKNINP